MRTPLPRLAAVGLILVLAWAQGQADVPAAEPEVREVARAVVEVGPAVLGPVPDWAIAGFNYGNSMRVVGYEDAFADVRTGTLRYPPGNQADEIHVGRHDLAALMMNVALLGRPAVLMVVNLFGGTPEGAAELARLAHELDIPVHAWEIGNEPDLYATNRGDPSWTPRRWCAAFRDFAAAVREVDPAARFAGPGVSGSRPSGEDFLRDVLRECGDAIDILTWHVYPTDGTASDEEALATSQQFTEEFARYRAWAADPEANPLGFRRELQFGVTEFGLSWRSPAFRHLEDMTAALWLADVLGRMTRERLDVSHYFALQAMGGHGLIDVGGWVRPTYHVYEMLSSFRGEALDVRAPHPLNAYAVRTASGMEILLVNTGAVAFQVELVPRPSGAMEVATLADPVFEARQEVDVRVLAAGEPVLVPARAVVHLTAPAVP